ncbi:MAG: flippase [Candidatus Magasanikbacteria bacterium]|nr:flippase [Candidatus Magasanikbacteria bacterium]
MSTTRKIAHNAIAQIASKIISTALGLVALGIMFRALGPEQFGWYITATSFLQFIGILIDFGLIPVTAQMLSEPAYEKNYLLKNLLGFRVVSALLFLAPSPLLVLFFPYPTPIKIAVGIMSIGFLATAVNQIFIGFYQTKLRTHIQAGSEVLGRILLVIGVVLLQRQSAAFLPMMAVVTASTIASTAVLWLSTGREIRLGLGFDLSLWRAIIQKMWPVAISIICNVVYLKGDVVLLSLFRSQTEVGMYGAAYRMLDVVTQSAMLLMGLLLPLLVATWSRGQREEFRHYLQRSFDTLMLFAVPIMVGTILLAAPIMQFIAGPKFSAAGNILRILSIAVFGVFIGAVFGHTALAIGRQKTALWIFASDAVITLIGYLVFIPKYGAMGAAWMSVFSELYAGFLLLLLVRHYSQIFPRLQLLGKIAAASLVMAFVPLFLPAAPVIITIILAGLVYLIALLGLRAVSRATLQEIFSMPP